MPGRFSREDGGVALGRHVQVHPDFGQAPDERSLASHDSDLSDARSQRRRWEAVAAQSDSSSTTWRNCSRGTVERRASLQASLHELTSLNELADRPAVVRVAYTIWLPLVHSLRYHWAEGTIHEATDLAIAIFYLFAVPFQMGFQTGVCCRPPCGRQTLRRHILDLTVSPCASPPLIHPRPAPRLLQSDFNRLYAIGYSVDALAIASQIASVVHSSALKASEKLQRAVVAAFSTGPHGTSEVHGPRRFSWAAARKHAPAACMVVLVLPYDAALWTLPSAPGPIPYVRLTRCVFGIVKTHHALVLLERFQVAPFYLCRMLRVLLFFIVATHILACTFFFFCQRPEASHFASAPWLPLTQPNATSILGSHYLRSMYCAPCDRLEPAATAETA